MGKSFNSGISIGFSIFALLGAAFSVNAATYKPVCVSAGHTLLANSEHFEICKKAKHDDGSANNATLDATVAQNALKTLENIFSVYHDSMQWMYPQPSNANEKLKSVAYIFEDSKMGALYGGGNTEACVKNGAGKDECSPGLWLGSGAFKDLWGLAHEYAHGLQSVAGWMGSNATAGWICESHANWMAHQVNPTDAHYCSEALINFPYLYYGSSRDRYCNWQFMEHLKEEFGGGWKGVQQVNRMWMNKINDGEAGYSIQTPFSAMLGAYNWTYQDMTDQFGKFAMKNATLEYAGAKKALYQKTWGDYEFATRRTVGSGDIYRRHSRVTMLNKVDSFYQVPSYGAPQRFGYNLVRIYPDSVGKVTVKFRGNVQESKPSSEYGCQGTETIWEWSATQNKWVQRNLCNLSPETMPDPGSSWTVGLVAEGSDGTPRYSEMKSGTAFNLDIETKPTDKALWLTVTATPKELYTITWDQFYYTIYRYPYMIRVENGVPEGYTKNFWTPSGYDPATDTAPGYKRHENGNGWVSTKATVAATAYVGPEAMVLGGTVSGNAIVDGRALVTGGTITDDAVLQDDAWLVSGTIKGKAKVGALSIIVNSTIADDAQVYGVMWAVADKKLSGTAQLRGDLENNFTKELTSGVFYGMVDDGMLSDPVYGAGRTQAPEEATQLPDISKWYTIDEDKDTVDPQDPASLINRVRPTTIKKTHGNFDAKGRVQNMNGTRSRNKFYKLF